MTKAIWVVIIIAVVVVGGYFLFKGGYQAPAPSPAPTEKEAGPEKPQPTAPEETPEAAVPPVKEFAVSGDEYSFSPSSITVSAGDEVKLTFSNEGGIKHNLVIEGLGISTSSISPGQTETLEFTAPASGTYNFYFYCSIPGHRARGMEGSLEVE